MIIRRLSELHREDILRHFEQLSPQDLYLRFCTAMNADSVACYVERLNVDRDMLLGAFDGDRLVGFCHLATPIDKFAEVGISMLETHRAQGLGSKMMRRAKVYAKVMGAKGIYISCMSDNTPMIRLARKNGVDLRLVDGGYEGRGVSGKADLFQIGEAVRDEQIGVVVDAIDTMMEPARAVERFWSDYASTLRSKNEKMSEH